MESVNFEVIKYIVNQKLDLKVFMGIDKDEEMFTKKYLKELKRCYKKNCLKYHPDKIENATEEEMEELTRNFTLNKVIYTILSEKEVYDHFQENLKNLDHKDHNDLKETFKSKGNDYIKELIAEATGGKTFDELSKEKEIEHGATNLSLDAIPQEEFNNKLEDYMKSRDNLYEEIKIKKLDINVENNADFMKLFNKEFENNVNTNTNISNEIMAYNDANSLVNTNVFDYQNTNYSSLYSGNGGYSQSFELLTSNVPKYVDSNISFEELMRQREKTTNEIESFLKKCEKEN
jgi:hypothetical protein